MDLAMRPWSLLLLLFYISFEHLWQITVVSGSIVSTKYGKLKGLSRQFDKSIGLGNVSTVNKFLGIPYAAPPIGDLRFRPPKKPKSWKGLYDATDFKPICYQDSSYNAMFWPNGTWLQSDDCLYLNVYAPNTSSRGVRYPVMVYIHGGGYEAGSPVVSPGDVLPLWDVVLVTIQYRLGPFGFLSTGDSEAPGNYGMLDQIEALKWIQENIGVFNGDPSRVTIFGESAGGSSVGLLLLSPLSKGFFHRAIALSGIDFSPFALNTREEAINRTLGVALRCDCPRSNNAEMIACLRQVKDPNKIWTKKDVNLWRPVVDEIFLPDTPLNLRKAKKFHPYPLIAGLTSEDGSYQLQAEQEFPTFDSFIAIAKRMYNDISRLRGIPTDIFERIINAISFQYAPWPDIDNHEKLRRGLIDLITDCSIAAPEYAVLEQHTKVAPGYLFVFSHRSKFNGRSDWRGATHKDDTPYEFGFPFMNFTVLQKYDKDDEKVSEYMIKYFTNFARTGNPTPEPVGGSVWKQFNSNNPFYMNITTKPSLQISFHRKGIAFWINYYPTVLNSSSSCRKIVEVMGSTSGSAGSYKVGIIDILTLFILSTFTTFNYLFVDRQ